MPGEGSPELTLRLTHPLQAQEGSAKAERPGLQNMELAPVQRKIEARSAEDSFTGFVRTLYFADTYLRDSEWPAWGWGAGGSGQQTPPDLGACRGLLPAWLVGAKRVSPCEQGQTAAPACLLPSPASASESASLGFISRP